MDNLLNAYKNIEVISAQSETGLRDKLQKINIPFGLVNIYFDGNKHVAWVVPDRKFTPKIKRILAKLDEQVTDGK